MNLPAILSLGTPFDLEKNVAAKVRALNSQNPDSLLIIDCKDAFESLAWILATFYCPTVAVPLPPDLPTEIRHNYLKQLPRERLIFTENLGDSLDAAYPHSMQPKSTDQMWTIIFSSGSTGEPKGVALSGTALKNSAHSHGEHNGKLSWLLNLPLYHVSGFSILSRAFFLGTAIGVETEKFSPPRLMEWLRVGIEGVSLVPTQLYRLLLAPTLDATALKLVLLGGAAGSQEQIEEALKRKIPIRRTYGLTEAASQLATEKESLSGLVPLPGVRFRLSGEGEISVCSNTLAMGYWIRGDLHSLPLKEGFFSTGDLGSFVDGILRVEGRKSEVIHSGGNKIFPFPIEQALLSIPGIEDAVVFGLPHPEWGEVVCAALVGGKNVGQTSIIPSLREKLEPKQIPKLWFDVQKVPRTALGKLERARWMEIFSQQSCQVEEL